MRRNLIRYVPDILKRSLEIQIIMRVQGEGLVKLWESAQAVFDDQFITTADEYGIARFEGILDLHPASTDTLEQRRAEVLMAWRASAGHSMQTVQAICDAWRAGEIEAAYEASAGLIMLYFLSDWPTEGRMRELTGLLDRVKPANLALKACLSRTMYLYGLGYLQSCNLDIAISVPMPDGN